MHHRRVIARVLSMAAACLLASGLAACGGSGTKAGADRSIGGPPPPLPTKDYTSALVVSDLRERALSMLQAAGNGKDAQLRANSAEAAIWAPARLTPLVASGLKDENLGVRTVAAVTVGRAGLKDLTPSVRPLLRDPSPYVYAGAIFGLAKNNEPVDPTPLADLLLGDPSPKVRSHVAFLLGEMGQASALPMLRQAARAPMPRAMESEVRLMQLQIAEAMVKLGDEQQIQSIRAALYPARPEELEATALAVQIIGLLRDRGSIDQLVYLSAYRDRAGQMMPAEVRLGIAAALARMGHKQGNFIAEQYLTSTTPAIRAQCTTVYAETGRPESLARLDQLMNDPEPFVRVAAAIGVVKGIGQSGGQTGGQTGGQVGGPAGGQPSNSATPASH